MAVSLFGVEAIKVVTLAVFKSLITTGGKALYQLNESFQQAVFQASKQYSQNYLERHGILKVLGMREPIPLESLYIAVQLLDNETIRYFETVEALEQVYRQSQERRFRFKNHHKQPGLAIANQVQYLMVLGGPGTGKSTFLRKVGIEALKGKQEDGFQHSCIPVFIELKEFRFEDINLEQAIAREFKICGFPYHESFTLEALRQGKLLIILDGLDELPSERMNEAIARIKNFVDTYDKNRFIASCRLAAYRHNFKRFVDVEMSDFDDSQIQNFIQNWFINNPEKGQEFWEKLTSSDYGSTKELTHTPLLLTLTCLLYQRAGQFPTNRATLYEKALRVLLEEWSGEKGLPQETLYQGLDTKRKELMLAEIAHHAFQEDRLFLSKRELVQQIERALSEMLPNESFIDGEAVLKSIEIQHGVLVERAEGVYSFSHLTLQEFLTAQYIVDTRQPVEPLINNYLHDNRWREVFLLLAGLQRADEMLLKMEQQSRRSVSTPNLQSLLNWADEATRHSASSCKPSVKRAVAIFLALDLAQALALDHARVRALDLDVDLVRTLAIALDHSLTLNRAFDLALARALDLSRAIDLVLDITRKFEEFKVFKAVNFNMLIARLEALKLKAPMHQQTLATRKAFVERVHQAWLDALNLRREWIDLSRKEVAALNQYLSVNLLIVQCRRSAVWVSSQTWKDIETKMLCASRADHSKET